MILGFAFGTDCAVLLAEADVARVEGGWREQTRLEIQATPRCSHVSVPLPAGVTLTSYAAREKRLDARSGPVQPHQWSISGRSVDGSAVATVYTPELTAGDRLIVEVTRTAPPGPLRWEPGAPTAFTSLTRDGQSAFWTETGAAAGYDLDDGARPSGPEALLPAGAVTVERHLRLVVPDGDPQLVLYPGGGSSVVVTDFLVVPAADEARGWPIDAPLGAEVEVVSEPEGRATLRADGVLRIEPSTVPTKVRASWTLPDAPTFGERDDGWSALHVRVEDGVVRWEGDQWFLHRVNGGLVLPDRSSLERALDARFRGVAMPEPGSPMSLRGAQADWATAAAISEALADKVAIAEHTSLDPLFPRRLTRAVRSGALTPVEAGLVAWLWARQQRLDADWFLVRPASRGIGGPTVPSGYDRALVRIAVDGEVRWLDPACRICAPFELPPDLEGASLLGARAVDPPPLTPGVERVVVTEGAVSWYLEGPPALELRAWLREIPAEGRADQLARRLAGPGAQLTSLAGADVAGAPIEVVASRGAGLVRDPLATAPAEESAWWPWIGTRELRYVGGALEPATLTRPGLTYARALDGDAVVERLEVRERSIPAAVARELDAARINRPEPAPETP